MACNKGYYGGFAVTISDWCVKGFEVFGRIDSFQAVERAFRVFEEPSEGSTCKGCLRILRGFKLFES